MARSTISSVGSRTDVGCVRKHNEDSLVVSPPLYAVADGMGGHEAGEVASEIAIEALTANAPAHPDAKALGRAVRAANKAVLRGVADGQGKPGMGTTMTAAVIEENHIALAQVGDSRAYLLHAGNLQQLTRDHSLVADLIEQGIITENEARYHPKRSVITRALGSDAEMSPDLYDFEAASGDRLLICSDGLTGMIEDDRVSEILAENNDPQAAADALVQAACDAGGHDNVTAIVVDIERENDSLMPGWQIRKRVLWIFAWLVAAVGVIALAFFGIQTYAKSSAFLTTDSAGRVVAFQGLPGEVAGFTLSWPLEDTPEFVAIEVYARDLSDSQRQKLEEGWMQDSVEGAKRTLEALDAQVNAGRDDIGNEEESAIIDE